MVKPDLQRRLAAAHEARRQAARRAGATPAPPAEPTSSTVDDGTGASPTVIDLRTVRLVRETTERARRDADERERVASPTPSGPRSAFADTPLAPAPLRTWSPVPASMATDPVPDGAGDRPEDIDLRAEAVLTTTPLQERCPSCGGPLRLDMFDLVSSVAHLTCVDCGHLTTARSPHV